MLILLFLFPGLLSATHFAYFQPPKEWQGARPKSYAPSVRLSFISPKRGLFPPSLNLAVEEEIPSLDIYLEAVKKIHSLDKNNRWRHLGALETACGKGT